MPLKIESYEFSSFGKQAKYISQILTGFSLYSYELWHRGDLIDLVNPPSC